MLSKRGEASSPKEIVRDLHEGGAACVPGFFDTQFVEKMRSEAAILLETQADGVKRLEPHPSGKMVWVFSRALGEQNCSHLDEALNSPFFKEIASSFDPKCRFFRNAIITHDYKPCKITDIHFDTQRTLKFMIYLSDVDKESAAFRYALGSHRQNRKLRNRYLLMGGKLGEIPNVLGPTEHVVLTDMEGPAGTLIMFVTDGFHTAGQLKQGNERLLIRSTSVLSDWFSNRVLRNAAERNPLSGFAPLVVPKGRQTTRGNTRAS